MNRNPFNLTFGKEPDCTVSRNIQSEDIISDFSSDNPSSQVYIITGVRGHGKTVMLTNITRHFLSQKGWIVINLNPERDLLQAFAANLYEHPSLKKVFIKAKLNLSAFGIGFSIENEPAISDIEVAIRKMLDIVLKRNERVLIAIDEASNSSYMKVFASAFQMLIRFDYPLFLLMTGLYENIRVLMDEKTLTFLYRAPRIELKPLGIKAMSNLYKKVLRINDKEATQLAVFTKGYPFAFQVVGYYKYKNKCSLEDLIPEFDRQMEEKVYEKIWTELSEGDKSVVRAIASTGRMKTKDIIAATNNTSSTYSVYRRRLSNKGIINTDNYGYAELTLPRFAEFLQNYEYVL